MEGEGGRQVDEDCRMVISGFWIAIANVWMPAWVWRWTRRVCVCVCVDVVDRRTAEYRLRILSRPSLFSRRENRRMDGWMGGE